MDKTELKKRKETRRIILIVVLILFESSFFDWLRTLHVRYGVYDYTVTYEEQLDTLFGDDYEIGPPETFCGYHGSSVWGEQFYDCYSTWPIVYTDFWGGKHRVTLSNADSRDGAFEWDVYGWMQNLAADHFSGVCQNGDYAEGICHIDLLRPSLYLPGERYRDVFQKYIQDNVIESFKDPDKLPHLYEMRFEDWFVKYPSYFYVHVRGDKVSDDILNDVLDDFNEMTGGRFNLEIKADDEVRYYIMGEPRSFENFFDYDSALYQEYEKMGMFD